VQVHLPVALPSNLFVDAKITGTSAKALVAESPILDAVELLSAL
jgi:hypothetical protein